MAGQTISPMTIGIFHYNINRHFVKGFFNKKRKKLKIVVSRYTARVYVAGEGHRPKPLCHNGLGVSHIQLKHISKNIQPHGCNQ